MPIPRHYTLTSEDCAAIAQWKRTILAAYAAVAVACVASLSASNYLSPADASASAIMTVSEVASSTSARTAVVAPAQPQTQVAFQTGADTPGSDALAENAWDFNRPETIPGFGPMTPTASPVPQASNTERASAAEQPGVDIRAVLDDPAMRSQVGLVENDWDFNNPENMPGFGAMPAADEPRHVARAPKASDDSQLLLSAEW